MVDQLVWIIGVPIIIILVIMIVRRVIALNAAIREQFEENAKGVKDPYAKMAAVANVQAAIDEEMRRSRQAKELLRLGRKAERKK